MNKQDFQAKMVSGFFKDTIIPMTVKPDTNAWPFPKSEDFKEKIPENWNEDDMVKPFKTYEEAAKAVVIKRYPLFTKGVETVLDDNVVENNSWITPSWPWPTELDIMAEDLRQDFLDGKHLKTVKPEQAPASILYDSTSGIHPVHYSAYLRNGKLVPDPSYDQGSMQEWFDKHNLKVITENPCKEITMPMIDERVGTDRRETDPNGIDQNSPGAKVDAGKMRTWLMFKDFSSALEEVAKVTTVGANKYTPGGWLSVPNGEERYMDAFARHAISYGKGERVDDGPGGTNCLHLAQMIWNLLAVLELEQRRGFE